MIDIKDQDLLFSHPFDLESGGTILDMVVHYRIISDPEYSPEKIIWICHALTANTKVDEWWNGLYGRGKLLDPTKYLIVCANNIGSCYGSTGPFDSQDESFPLVTPRDIAKAFDALRRHLKIDKIDVLMGGSQGGHIAMEWAYSLGTDLKYLVLLSTNSRHSAWGIAFNEAQRLALSSGDVNGLAAARAIAMLSYRSYEMYNRTWNEDDDHKLENFGPAGYQQYQGNKLVQRFSRESYYSLTKTMDAHNIGRGREGEAKALSQIVSKTLVIGISSDFLFPTREQVFLANNIPNAVLNIIDSPFGHDGFLTETDKINALAIPFINHE